MCLPGGNRRVELAEFGGLPGMVGPVKAIEFAQHRRRSRSSLRFLQSAMRISTRVPKTKDSC